MRIFVAWLLLSLLSFYWIGGQLLHHINISCDISLERQMNQEEKRLSQHLHTLTGIDRSVLIIQDEELDLSGIGYSGTFLFNEVVNGKPIYYIVETSQATQIVEVDKNIHTPLDDLEYSVSFDHLFPKYLNAIELPLLHQQDLFCTKNFPVEAIIDGIEPCTPTPPPRLG
jgi:hypothetical protein